MILNLDSADTTQVEITQPSTKTLTFDATNWNTRKTVTVKGKNDATPAVVNHQTNVTISVNTTSTTAQNYRAALSQNVRVETIDDVSNGTIIATGVGSNEAAALSIGGSFVGIQSAWKDSLAVGDVTGDGVMDYVLGSVPFGPSSYSVLDGVTHNVIRSVFPFGESYRGGVNVALGDVNKDGKLDIIASQAINSQVIVSDGRTSDLIYRFTASVEGATVSSADVNGDGFADIVLSARTENFVQVFSGIDHSLLYNVGPKVVGFFSGVAAADLIGDGNAEIVLGVGGGTESHVKVFQGQTQIADFVPFPSFSGPLFVAVDSLSKNIIVGMGRGGSTIGTFSSTGQLLSTATPFGSSTDGVQVAASSTTATPRPTVPVIRFLPGTNYRTDSQGIPATNQRSVTATVDFGVAVSGFQVSDLVISGGTAELINQVNGLYQIRLRASREGLVTVDIPAGAVSDAVNGVSNDPLASPFSFQYDQLSPEPTIFIPLSTSLPTLPGTITFREGVPGNFDASKLTATNGTISALTRTGDASFAFTLTSTSTGQITTVSLVAGFVNDVAGNSSTAKTVSTTFLAIAPLAPKLSSTEVTSTTLSPIPMQVDFGTNVTGLSASTPAITNGTVKSGSVQNLGSGKYTFSVVPTVAGTVTVTIPANLVMDAANSSRKNVVSETLSLNYHPTAPKPEFLVTGITNGGSSTLANIPFQVVFSAPVDGFTVDDIHITGGTIENFQREQSQPNYTFDVVSNGTGQVSLDIPAGVAKDVDLVDNLASEPFTFQSLPEGDVAVMLDSPPPTAKAGDDIYYLVTVSNYGAGTVTGATATATLPSDLSYVPITGFLADSRVSASGQTVTIRVGDLAAHAQQLFTVQLKLKAGVLANTVESVTFNVTSGNDSILSNNSATFAKTVVAGSTTPTTSATVKDATNGGDVTVSVPANSNATITNLVSTPILALATNGISSAALPVGVNISATSFRVNNAPADSEIVVTLRPPNGVPNGATFTKYGKLPGSSTSTLFNFMYDSNTGLGAQMFPDRIEIHLRDGKLGDDDGLVNGVIVDPGFMTSLNPVAPYQSTINNLDVDDDGTVSPLDILQLINDINVNGTRPLPSVVPMPVSKFPFLDTDGDGSISPLDVLLVINFINARASGAGGEGEKSVNELHGTLEREGEQPISSVPLFASPRVPEIATALNPLPTYLHPLTNLAMVGGSVAPSMLSPWNTSLDSLPTVEDDSPNEKSEHTTDATLALNKSIDDFFAGLANKGRLSRHRPR